MKAKKPFIIYIDGGFDTQYISDAIYKYTKAIDLSPIRFETTLNYTITKKMNSIGIKHDLNWYFFHRDSKSLNSDKDIRLNNLFNYIALQELDISKSIYDLMNNTSLIDVYIVKNNSIEKLFEGLLKIYLESDTKPSKIVEDLPDLINDYKEHLNNTGVIKPDIFIYLKKPTIKKYYDIKASFFEELYFLTEQDTIKSILPFFTLDNIDELSKAIVEKDDMAEDRLSTIKFKDSINSVYPDSHKLYIDDLNNFINKFKNLLIKERIIE